MLQVSRGIIQSCLNLSPEDDHLAAILSLPCHHHPLKMTLTETRKASYGIGLVTCAVVALIYSILSLR